MMGGQRVQGACSRSYADDASFNTFTYSEQNEGKLAIAPSSHPYAELPISILIQ